MQRRSFLSLAASALSVGARAGGLLTTSLASSLALAQGASTNANGRRLILIELDGANDGLNTLVPWRHDRYRAARPSLALQRNELIDINGDIGLHASLKPLMPLLDRGELVAVQGLGYPAPNRSHFSSSAYWHTGGDGEQGRNRRGWLTHDIEHRFADVSVHGLSLVDRLGPLDSADGRWLTASSVAQLAALSLPQVTDDPSMPKALERVAMRVDSVERMLGNVRQELEAVPHVPEFPGDGFGAQLREVTRFIGAGLQTPVFRVKLSGFDTHANQRGRHERLLSTLAKGLAALRNELVAMGEWDATLVMTHSEFGRRVAENDSGGTDHGTAAPQFLAGGALQSGDILLGQAPDLNELVGEDPVATMDYRVLYDQVLGGWFDIDDNRFASFRGSELKGLLNRA